MAYKPTGAHKGCLKSKLLESRYAIFECHEACQCSTECPNRVVDNGRKIPLEIFRTDNGRGWGKFYDSTCNVRTMFYC